MLYGQQLSLGDGMLKCMKYHYTQSTAEFVSLKTWTNLNLALKESPKITKVRTILLAKHPTVIEVFLSEPQKKQKKMSTNMNRIKSYMWSLFYYSTRAANKYFLSLWLGPQTKNSLLAVGGYEAF